MARRSMSISRGTRSSASKVPSVSARDSRAGLTFAVWRHRVDAALIRHCGLGIDDLIDVDYWSMWDAGTSVDDTVMQVLDANDYPFNED